MERTSFYSAALKQFQGQARTMLPALQDHTQHRPTTDGALMNWIIRYAAWLIVDAQSPWASTVDNCWNLASPCWLTAGTWERDQDLPCQSLLTDGNLRFGWKERPP